MFNMKSKLLDKTGSVIAYICETTQDENCGNTSKIGEYTKEEVIAIIKQTHPEERNCRIAKGVPCLKQGKLEIINEKENHI